MHCLLQLYYTIILDSGRELVSIIIWTCHCLTMRSSWHLCFLFVLQLLLSLSLTSKCINNITDTKTLCYYVKGSYSHHPKQKSPWMPLHWNATYKKVSCQVGIPLPFVIRRLVETMPGAIYGSNDSMTTGANACLRSAACSAAPAVVDAVSWT